MILGFKDQFEADIVSGRKRHSIRGGKRWKKGMRADLYVRPRRKDMRLLFRAMVTAVDDIRIEGPPAGFECPDCYKGQLHHHMYYSRIAINGVPLDPVELELFAEKDGFHGDDDHWAFERMINFWCREHGFDEASVFIGQVVHWNYENRFMEKPQPEKKKRDPLAVAVRLARGLRTVGSSSSAN